MGMSAVRRTAPIKRPALLGRLGVHAKKIMKWPVVGRAVFTPSGTLAMSIERLVDLVERHPSRDAAERSPGGDLFRRL